MTYCSEKTRTILFLLLFCVPVVAARPLKVLFVVDYFPVISATFVLNQITELLNRDHDVTIFSFHKGDFSKMHSDIEKYQLLARTKYNKLPKDCRKFDIIYCQFGFSGTKMAKLIKNGQGPEGKLVVCFRGSDLTKHLKEELPDYKRLFKAGDLFLPVCKYFKKNLVKLGCDPKKIVVHHSAIDCKKFFCKRRKEPKKDKIHIVSIGRLIGKKGLDDALKAVIRIIKKYPHVRYTIVGDGKMRGQLERLIEKSDMQKKIILFGWANRDEVVRILNKADIFLLPSKTSSDHDKEGIPNVLKEAMACGLPVVSTYHAGIPELVEDGVSGLLVPEGDVDQLVAKLAYLIKNRNQWKKMGKAGRKKVEQEYELEAVVDKLEKLFYRLLKNKVKA